MRDPETMRLTLNAAETGHLVLATMHSSSCVEALQRMVSASAPETQNSVTAQLADCLIGVVSQRLRFRSAVGLLVPECEILMASSAMRGVLRVGQLFRLATVLEGGGQDGSFTFQRYQEWLDAKTDWSMLESERVEQAELQAPTAVTHVEPAGRPGVNRAALTRRPRRDGVLQIDDAEDPAHILAQLNQDSGEA